MTEPRKIIVVGAGIIGASIAWHLALAGGQVLVVDGGAAGGIATANSFAWINASWGNPEPYFRLRSRAIAEWRRLALVVPALPLTWTGGLCWDMPRDQLEAYARQHGGWGYDVRLVGAADIRSIEPNLVSPPPVAAHVAEEAAVEARAAACILLDDAAKRGARVRLNTPVTALLQAGATTTGIAIDGDVFAADDVVVAAGAATAALLATAGVFLPMSTSPGLLVHSRPHSRLLNGIVLAPGLHMRQTVEGRIVSGADFGGADPGADAAATAQVLFTKTRAMLAGSHDLEMQDYTIGHRPIPAGGFPFIGRPDSRLGLLVAVMHSGVTLAPIVGRLVADELLTGRRDPLLIPYRPPPRIA